MHPFYGTSSFSFILSHSSTMQGYGVEKGMGLFYIHIDRIKVFRDKGIKL